MTDEFEPREWPPEYLENVPNCPVCGNAERTLLHGELTDRVYRVAPGKWTLYCCSNCCSVWLDPRPKPESLGLAYASYYTHDASDHPIVRRLGPLRMLLHDALNGYMNSRYGLSREPAISLGRWLIPLYFTSCGGGCGLLTHASAAERWWPAFGCWLRKRSFSEIGLRNGVAGGRD